MPKITFPQNGSFKRYKSLQSNRLKYFYTTVYSKKPQKLFDINKLVQVPPLTFFLADEVVATIKITFAPWKNGVRFLNYINGRKAQLTS